MKCGLLFVFSCVAFVFLVVSPVFASSALITDVEYWLAPDHIQTIISFDREVKPSSHHRSDPDRFVLEIPNCAYINGKETIPVNDVTLQQIRVQRLSNGTTQIVFDLSKQIDTTIQTLSSFNGQPDRVIVNLFDASSKDQIQQKRVERHQITKQLKQDRYRIVVLDPGHGGWDPGACRNGLKEKDIVLEFALNMKKILEKKAPHLKVYLTRDSDYYLTFLKRTEIAREYNADLFISLHVNANESRRVHGFSVYTLSENATDDAARKLAEQENAVDLLFRGVETPAPTKDSLLTFVLADLSTTASLQHSLEFGQLVLNTAIAQLRKYSIYKEGLKRANFAVLRSADMPAVLVEACYISNKREQKLLRQKEFRMNIADSLAKSVIDYFAQMSNSFQPQMVQLQDSPPNLPTIDRESPGSSVSPSKVHVVKSGESLSVIAGKYDVDLSELRQVNKLASADLIYVGQRLWIP